MQNVICWALFLLLCIFNVSTQQATSSSSYDSLIASQCRARCLALYPWGNRNEPPQMIRRGTGSKRNRHRHKNRHKHKRYLDTPNELWYIASSSSNSQHKQFQRRNIDNATTSTTTNAPLHPQHNVKWSKVLEMCQKNTHCLQCSLPCEIPTNLLSSCKFLCKNNHPLCIESCNLMTKLSEQKYGSCPSSSPSSPSTDDNNKCSAESKASAYRRLMSAAAQETASTRRRRHREPVLPPAMNECSRDSECVDMRKCCPVDAQCPQFGNVCQKSAINIQNLPPIPYNLTIKERKKGKTIILSWDCITPKSRPAIFVVEGRWSLKSPINSTNNIDDDEYMTKWGYLAQTINNNWLILRNINRGRWYKFRVAAVSRHGSLGYSASTPLFILSSAPKASSPPQNLTVVQQSQRDSLVNVELSWLAPKRSDMPVSQYKVLWEPSSPNDVISQQEEYSTDDLAALERRVVANGGGHELVDNDYTTVHRTSYTVRQLRANSLYTVYVVALSRYDTASSPRPALLVSVPQRLRIDTSKSQAAVVAAGDDELPPSRGGLDSAADDDEDNEDNEDDDEEQQPQKQLVQPQQQQQQQQPIIRNLTVQTPYFQNGLVKAKLTWQIENSPSPEMMFTLSWFAIKCQDHMHRMPSLIQATTVHTEFEIYELKYNCDYVVNVRLSSSAASSLQKSRHRAPPQVTAAQFRVPTCSSIKIVGRIRPYCPTTTTTATTSGSSSSQPSTEPLVVVVTVPPTTTTTAAATVSQLPRVYNVRFKIVDKSQQANNFHSVEFSWSPPSSTALISGYQISVLPKGGSGDSSGVSSIGAIVERGQSRFVVRQLSTAVRRYVFQIQTISLDNQSYGPVTSLEFNLSGENDYYDDDGSGEVDNLVPPVNKKKQQQQQQPVTSSENDVLADALKKEQQQTTPSRLASPYKIINSYNKKYDRHHRFQSSEETSSAAADFSAEEDNRIGGDSAADVSSLSSSASTKHLSRCFWWSLIVPLLLILLL